MVNVMKIVGKTENNRYQSNAKQTIKESVWNIWKECMKTDPLGCSMNINRRA
jgi:hypothetical protein